MRIRNVGLLLRAGRPRVLVSNQNRVGWACTAPVARRLAEDPRLRVFYAARFRKGIPPGEDLRNVRAFHRSQGVSHGLLPWRDARYAAFDVAIVTHSSRSLLPKRARKHAACFHGVSFKNFLLQDRNVARADQLWVPGPYHRRRLVELGLCAEDDPRLCAVGMPKTDALFAPTPSRDDVLRSLAFDPAAPTVVIAPTGMPGNAFDVCGPDLVARLNARGIQVVLKPHDHPRGGEAARKACQEACGHLSGPLTRAVWNPDCSPLLKAADVLVTDASSVSFEGALIGRPIVFVDVPAIFASLRAEGVPLDLDTWGRKIGTVVRDGREGEAAIARILARRDDGHGEVRRACVQDMFYNHGAATDAAVRAVYSLLGMGPPARRLR